MTLLQICSVKSGAELHSDSQIMQSISLDCLGREGNGRNPLGFPVPEVLPTDFHTSIFFFLYSSLALDIIRHEELGELEKRGL